MTPFLAEVSGETWQVGPNVFGHDTPFLIVAVLTIIAFGLLIYVGRKIG